MVVKSCEKSCEKTRAAEDKNQQRANRTKNGTNQLFFWEKPPKYNLTSKLQLITTIIIKIGKIGKN